MSKIEVRRFDRAKDAGSKPASVKLKKVRSSEGEVTTVRSIDANSGSFASDFLYVFKQNVRAARAENKAKLGFAGERRKAR